MNVTLSVTFSELRVGQTRSPFHPLPALRKITGSGGLEGYYGIMSSDWLNVASAVLQL